MTTPTAGSGFSAELGALAQIPTLLTDIKAGVLAARALVSTPRAAVSTGTLTAGAAIGVLGLELIAFLVDTVEAIDDDIDNLRGNAQNYEQADLDAAAGAQAGGARLASRPELGGPTLHGGTQAAIGRAVLTAGSALDDIARAEAWMAHQAGDAAQAVLGAGQTIVRGTADAVAGVVDGVPWIGDETASFVRGTGDAGGDVLQGASDGVQAGEDWVQRRADEAAALGDRYERMNALRGSFSTGGGA